MVIKPPMALPFLSGGVRRRDQIVAIDLGSHATKAVHLQRKGDGFAIANYVIKPPSGAGDKGVSALADHLREVGSELGVKAKGMVLSVGVSDSMLRHADMPMVPVSDMRLMLKFNPKTYLLQDLQGHVFDCYVLPPSGSPGGAAEVGKHAKCKVLVGGAKQQLVEDMQQAAKTAGWVAEMIVPALIGPLNAFELAQPQVFAGEVVGLVDIGFKNTSISILMNGELALSRVVGIGGDRLTAGLAEAMSISYQEAEQIKVGMPSEVQSNLETLLIPLGRELRASIDAFEHQQDKAVSQVFISGGPARSETIVQTLQSELMVPCKGWSPVVALQMDLPPQKMGEIEQMAPQLAVAVGAGLAAF